MGTILMVIVVIGLVLFLLDESEGKKLFNRYDEWNERLELRDFSSLEHYQVYWQLCSDIRDFHLRTKQMYTTECRGKQFLMNNPEQTSYEIVLFFTRQAEKREENRIKYASQTTVSKRTIRRRESFKKGGGEYNEKALLDLINK